MNIILAIILIIIAIIALGASYEFLSVMRDKRKYKTPSGTLVDVNGIQLHMNLMGDREANQPVIVFDSGVGANALDWQKVQPQVAQFAQTITYDRAGYGWSDRGIEPRTPQRIVDELHTMLQNAEIEPPYILVGHSFGGIYVRLFAGTHPDEVAGLILVDSSHPEMLAARNTEPEIKRLKNVQRFQRIGVVRLMLPRILSRANHLTGEPFKQYLAFNLLDNFNTLREAEPLFRDGIELAEHIDVPLTVISRERDDDIATEKSWSDSQDKLADLSPNAKHIRTESSSHWTALSEPETVVDVIRNMLDELDSHN